MKKIRLISAFLSTAAAASQANAALCANPARPQITSENTGGIQPRVVSVQLLVQSGSVAYTVDRKRTVYQVSKTAYEVPSGGYVTCLPDKSGKLTKVSILQMPASLRDYSSSTPYYVPRRLAGEDIVTRSRNLIVVTSAGGRAGTTAFYAPSEGGYLPLRSMPEIRWHLKPTATAAQPIALQILDQNGAVLARIPLSDEQARQGAARLPDDVLRRLRERREAKQGSSEQIGLALVAADETATDRITVTTFGAEADADLESRLQAWKDQPESDPAALYQHLGRALVYLDNQMLYDYAVEMSAVANAFPDEKFVANAARAWSALRFSANDQSAPIPDGVRAAMESPAR